MKLTYLIIIFAFITCVIVSGCGGGGNTAVPSVNVSVTPSSGSGGTFSITVHIPGPENMEAKVIPWQRKTLRVTVKPETGLAAITPVTVDISGPGDYTATVPNVPVGLNEATIEVLDANDRLLAMRKHGFQMDHGGDVKPAGKIIMGVSLDPSGGLHCVPNYIEIKKGESLYVENQDTGAGYTVTIGSENHSVSPATASASPVTAATFPAAAFVNFSANAGVYNISAGASVLGSVKVYDYNVSLVPEMVFIIAGTFQMGDPNGGVGNSNERPRHQVTLTRNFYMSKYEIRNKEYICYDPAHTSGGGWSDPNYPVENVSWYNAVTYCNWLSAQQGLPLCYTDSNNDGNLDTVDIQKDGYRLPTEAEWEYACRAGETTFHDYYWDNMTPNTIGNYCWYNGNSGNHPNIVGTKLPNNFGLYDMSGNLWEWVNDWYGSYSVDDPNNPVGPGSGFCRVVRGACWGNDASDCRSAYRNNFDPSGRGSGTGFRPVRTDLTVYPAPSISGFTPGSGDEGETVTINGNFHSNPSNNIVTFNGVYTTTISATATTLTVKVPAGATTGKISVTTLGGTETSGENFIVTDTSGKMVLLPAGTFQMGDVDGGVGYGWERPRHEVTITYNFYMSRCEVTNQEYLLYYRYHTSGGGWTDPNYPVENVNWFNAAGYCNWLTDNTPGLGSAERCYDGSYNVDISKKGYRLPTEAEWEYACRAGETTFYNYYWVNMTPDTIGDYCWYGSNSGGQPHIVGTKLPNNFGLFDMSGNLWEWVNDWYGNYDGTAQTDPTGPGTGSARVLRGGSWVNEPDYCRSANRNGGPPDVRTFILGFRPVRSAP